MSRDRETIYVSHTDQPFIAQLKAQAKAQARSWSYLVMAALKQVYGEKNSP